MIKTTLASAFAILLLTGTVCFAQQMQQQSGGGQQQQSSGGGFQQQGFGSGQQQWGGGSQQQQSGGPFKGLVVQVIDGNTIVLRKSDGNRYKVHLHDLLVPEGNEPGAGQATANLKALASGKVAYCDIISQQQSDGYSSTTARCKVNGVDLTKKLGG